VGEDVVLDKLFEYFSVYCCTKDSTMHVIYPSTVIAGKKDTFSAFCVTTFETTRLPLGPQPFFRRPSFEFMPDSSIKMS